MRCRHSSPMRRPRLQDRYRLRTAAGIGLEVWVSSLVKNAGSASLRVVTTSKGIALLRDRPDHDGAALAAVEDERGNPHSSLAGAAEGDAQVGMLGGSAVPVRMPVGSTTRGPLPGGTVTVIGDAQWPALLGTGAAALLAVRRRSSRGPANVLR